MLLVPITPPSPVISLERAKLHCKITGNDRDVELTDAIETARAWAQHFLQRPIGDSQVLEATFEWWRGYAALPYYPFSVDVVTANGQASPYTMAGRTLTTEGIAPLVVRFTVKGFTAETLPGPIRSGMLLMVADLMANQQGQVESQLYENKAALNLMWPYRAELGT